MGDGSEFKELWDDLDELYNFLGGHYYQSVWTFFKTHEEIWKDYFERAERGESLRLVQEIEDLLERDPGEAFRALQVPLRGGGLYLEDAEAARTWLTRCRDFMRESCSTPRHG